MLWNFSLAAPRVTLAVFGALMLIFGISVIGIKADRATDSFLPRGDVPTRIEVLSA